MPAKIGPKLTSGVNELARTGSSNCHLNARSPLLATEFATTHSGTHHQRVFVPPKHTRKPKTLIQHPKTVSTKPCSAKQQTPVYSVQLSCCSYRKLTLSSKSQKISRQMQGGTTFSTPGLREHSLLWSLLRQKSPQSRRSAQRPTKMKTVLRLHPPAHLLKELC